ncbi:restriction endonuclease subunit S [Helicobacter cinaedi]|uniref:restriction endonuclease subunit S n=1 Tax=Helicobacter cinaedi TaxID=213 RepID=UPI001EED8E48|nr:restriction endonuclease subunit S [Helicobacter cinaedi]BDB67468.1 restriction endonuclease subunit S [Helicobacter cinaedi]
MQSFDLESLSLQPFLQSLHKEQWQEVRLGEVGRVVTGKTPSYKNPQDWGDSTLFITPTDYKNYHKYAHNSERKISNIGKERFVKNLLPIHSILVTCIGSDMGKVVVNKAEALTNQQINAIIPNNGAINYNFLYYSMVDMYPILRTYGANGTAVPILNKSDFENLTIPLPPLTIQQKIAEILSSFDDKIDLLHRQNKTLESLALTLFRHYFIDNPNRNEWELGKLGDYVKIIDNRGKTPPFTTDITPYPLIEVNALSDDSMLINYDIVRKYVIKETYQKWFREHIKQYDILFSTVGSIGEVAMLLDNKGCIAQNVIGFRARDISPFYLYGWLKYMQQEIKEFDIGSVQPSIKVTHFIEKQIYKPDSKILESFDKQMLLITDKISHNAKQIQNLQAMRDMLLKAIFA